MKTHVDVVYYRTGEEGKPAYKQVMTWCPGCDQAHPFTIEVYDDFRRNDGSLKPVWDWDGNLDTPTFNPSLLCYYTVHLCAGQHTLSECDGECGEPSHAILYRYKGQLHQYKVHEIPEGVEQVRGHISDHPLETPFGNCHSFLRNGVWEFLSDSAHSLAGQNVPMVEIPEWWAERYE